MIKQIFINGINSISPQASFENVFLDIDLVTEKKVFLQVINPNYKDFIPPVKLRRMAKFMKMGLVSALKSMQDANITDIDAIIVGSGNGNVGDTQKFLTAIIENRERMLVPTSFVQSTHNIVAGSIALALVNKGYNMTYSHHSSSFEMSLLDAMMLFDDGEISSAMVGAIDEITEENIIRRSNTNLWNKNMTNPLNIFSENNHNGAIIGESAAFFTLANYKTKNTYAQLIDVEINHISTGNFAPLLREFILKNNIETNEIDLVLGGFNGVDYYDSAQLMVIEQLMPNVNIGAYKNYVGEHPTASSFGLWLASNILKANFIPKEVFYKKKVIQTKPIENILLFHQGYLSPGDFAMVLVKRVN